MSTLWVGQMVRLCSTGCARELPTINSGLFSETGSLSRRRHDAPTNIVEKRDFTQSHLLSHTAVGN